MMTELIASPTATKPPPYLWRISVGRYHRMVRTGILTADDPVELLEGLLVAKVRKTPLHSVVTGLTRARLQQVKLTDWHVDSHAPITTCDSEPEPDVAVIRGNIFSYTRRHPKPSEAPLVIEIADASLQRDRGIKKRLYARAGIAVYWVINLMQAQIEVYTEPDQQNRPPDYRQRRIYRSADRLPVVLDGVEVEQILVSDILPPSTANKNEGVL